MECSFPIYKVTVMYCMHIGNEHSMKLMQIFKICFSSTLQSKLTLRAGASLGSSGSIKEGNTIRVGNYKSSTCPQECQNFLGRYKSKWFYCIY